MISCLPLFRPALRVAVVGLAFFALQLTARGERPVAPQLLPEGTLVMVRVADTPDLITKFRETAMGRMTQDEQVSPLVNQLYGTLQEAWTQIEERVGLPLDELLKIPQGEICVAIVSQGDAAPAIVLLLDVKDQVVNANKLLDKGEAFIVEQGGSKESETIEDVKVNIFKTPDGQSVAQFEKDGTIVLTTNKEVVKPLLQAWNGTGEAKTLADNEKFNSIMNRCGGGKVERPRAPV